jgi:probable F420-dependent oxidoreductase
MRNDPARHWAVVVPFVPAGLLADQARSYEAAGLAGIQAPQIYGPPFVPLAVVAAATTRAKLLSGIAIAAVRSPFETAMAAMDLDHLSEGRFILGLGTSVRAWSQGIYGRPFDRPVARLREAIELIRLVIAKSHTGELDRFEGTFHRHDFSELQPLVPPLRTEIPIWVAGNRRPVIRLAAEVADGVMGHPIWSVEWATHQGMGAVAEGLRRGRRSRADVHLHLGQFVALNPDRRQGIEDARATVAFYAGVESYEELFAAHGYVEVARRCQEGVQRGDYLSTAHHVPDEMVETFALCGPVDGVRERFRPLWEAGDSFCLYPPLFGLPPERTAAYGAAIAEAFFS